MSEYIDGFVFPIGKKYAQNYRRVASSIAEIWKEYGATEYREFTIEDPYLAGTRSFVNCVDATPEEMVILGWVIFTSREARDAAGQSVARDPRVKALMESAEIGFDPQRMLFGGFRPFIQV